jgi:hypothetical protein
MGVRSFHRRKCRNLTSFNHAPAKSTRISEEEVGLRVSLVSQSILQVEERARTAVLEAAKGGCCPDLELTAQGVNTRDVARVFEQISTVIHLSQKVRQANTDPVSSWTRSTIQARSRFNWKPC